MTEAEECAKEYVSACLESVFEMIEDQGGSIEQYTLQELMNDCFVAGYKVGSL